MIWTKMEVTFLETMTNVIFICALISNVNEHSTRENRYFKNLVITENWTMLLSDRGIIKSIFDYRAIDDLLFLSMHFHG